MNVHAIYRVSSVLALCAASLALCVATGCRSTPVDEAPASHEEAIRQIFAIDGRLGHERNEASRWMSVSRASAQYAQALQNIDYSNTPDDFQSAFLTHAGAWRAFAQTLEDYRHLDTHRLEMHEAIEQIQEADTEAAASLQRALDEVWSTWSVVEQTAGRYGVHSED